MQQLTPVQSSLLVRQSISFGHRAQQKVLEVVQHSHSHIAKNRDKS